jgi:hypothetical protein
LNPLWTSGTTADQNNVEDWLMTSRSVLFGIKGCRNPSDAESELRHQSETVVRKAAISPILNERSDIERNPPPLIGQQHRRPGNFNFAQRRGVRGSNTALDP